MTKKILIPSTLIFLSLASLSLVSAKILSKNALIGVSSIVLKNGRSYQMCNYTISDAPKTGSTTEAGIMVKEPASPINSSCVSAPASVVADLSYIYTNGSENQTDVLLLINDDLYRLDSTELVYNPENKQLVSKISSTLWKVDPTAPNGQVQAPGQLVEGYDDNGNPSSLTLTLGNKYYSGPFLKQVSDTTLLQVAPVEVSPTPGM